MNKPNLLAWEQVSEWQEILAAPLTPVSEALPAPQPQEKHPDNPQNQENDAGCFNDWACGDLLYNWEMFLLKS